MPDSNETPTDKPPLTGAGKALIGLGAFLLLVPGGCSLVAMLIAVDEVSRGLIGRGAAGAMFAAYGIPLTIFIALGVWAIRAGRRRRMHKEVRS